MREHASVLRTDRAEPLPGRSPGFVRVRDRYVGGRGDGEPDGTVAARALRAGTRTAGSFDGDEAVAWAQYGPPAEVPNIHHRKEYEATLDTVPDHRITCIFVDKKYRRTGVTAVALQGAIDLIAQAGGGVVEGYPHDTADGRKVSVLYNATRSLYETAGFTYVRPKGLRNCVMRRVVP